MGKTNISCLFSTITYLARLNSALLVYLVIFHYNWVSPTVGGAIIVRQPQSAMMPFVYMAQINAAWRLCGTLSHFGSLHLAPSGFCCQPPSTKTSALCHSTLVCVWPFRLLPGFKNGGFDSCKGPHPVTSLTGQSDACSLLMSHFLVKLRY